MIVSRLNKIASDANNYANLEPEYQNEYKKANKSVVIVHSQNLEKHLKTMQEIIKQAVKNIPPKMLAGRMTAY